MIVVVIALSIAMLSRLAQIIFISREMQLMNEPIMKESHTVPEAAA